MATCDRCEGPVENKDNRGWFRDNCWECIEAIAGEETTHRDECDDTDCLICSTP